MDKNVNIACNFVQKTGCKKANKMPCHDEQVFVIMQENLNLVTFTIMYCYTNYKMYNIFESMISNLAKKEARG